MSDAGKWSQQAPESLRKRTLKGAMWSGLESFGVAGVGFVVSLIIARILSPEQFGLIAMLQIFIMLAQTLVDSGMSAALIRKNGATPAEESTVFISNVSIGALCYAALYIAAPAVGRFYDLPELANVLRATGLCVPINSLCVVQQARFVAELRFRAMSIISLVAVTLSGCAGIFLAVKGYGVWALVWQQLTMWSLRCLLLWIAGRWIPMLVFSAEAFRNLWGFGWKLLVSGLIDTAYTNLYTLVMGKLFSPRQAGLYARSETMALFPAKSIHEIVHKVSYPVLSKLRDDKSRLSAGYARIISASAWITLPLMAVICSLSAPIILIVLGEKWLPAAPYLSLLCCAASLYPIHAINLNVLNVMGRSELFLKLEIVKKVIGTAILCATIPLGMTMLCVGLVVMNVIAFFINSHYTSRFVAFTIPVQLKLLSAPLGVAIIAGIAAYFGQLCVAGHPVAQVGVGISAAAVPVFTALLILRPLSFMQKKGNREN